MPPPWTLVQGCSVWWGTSPARKRRLINVARSTPMLGLSYRHHIQPSNLPQMEAPVTRHSGPRSRCAGGPLSTTATLAGADSCTAWLSTKMLLATSPQTPGL